MYYFGLLAAGFGAGIDALPVGRIGVAAVLGAFAALCTGEGIADGVEDFAFSFSGNVP